ncbi:MAG: hypothetical protein ABI904_18580 [Chloroflexota bacterium]
MKKSSKLLFSFLILIAFGACNVSNVTPEAPTSVGLTDTEFATPTSTAPFIPTVDPLTPTAIVQFFHTLEAQKSPTPEASPTPNYRDCSGNMFFMHLGNWGLCQGLRDPITIISQSNQAWQFSYKKYYGRDVPNPCTRLQYLTNDETFIYFSLDAECELYEPGFISSISVFRMDLSNGDVSEILKASYDFDSYTGNYYTISTSPTGRRLAYIADQTRPLNLNILDLKSGETRSYTLDEKYTDGGAYTWSEDGTKLAFMLESNTNNDRFISIIYLDTLKDNSMVTFINDNEFSWISSRIEITDRGVKVTPIDGESLFYDITTGVLSPANK